MSKRPTYSEKVESAQQETAHQKRPVEIKRDLLTQTEQDEIAKERFESDFIFRTETYTFLQRDLRTSKETCGHQKRPTHIQRDLRTSKETYLLETKPTHSTTDLREKDQNFRKENHAHKKRPIHIKRDRNTKKRDI